MNETERIFVDSNVLVATFRINDTLHQSAAEAIQLIEKQNLSLVISNFIFLEVVTVLSQRMDRATAVKAGDDLLAHPLVEVVHITDLLQAETWRIFRQVKNKNTSFVDCSVVAAMQAEGIKNLLTFDQTDFRTLRRYYRFRFWSPDRVK